MDDEIWKDIKGFEGYYQISNHGRVKSLAREVNARHGLRIIKESIRTPIYNSRSKSFSIILAVKEKKKHYRVDSLVAEAFLFNPCNLPKLVHLDGDRTNDHISNLEYQGLKAFGNAKAIYASKRKLSKTDKQKILFWISQKESYQSIAERYGVSPSVIFYIKHGGRKAK